MIKKLFTVYDEKSQAYLPPFFMDTEGQAVRAITDCANDLNHHFCRHAADFTLFYLGEFDDSSAQITMDPKSMGSLVEYKSQELIMEQVSLRETPNPEENTK